MPQGLTLQQLQSMSGQPTSQPSGGGLTLEQLQGQNRPAGGSPEEKTKIQQMIKEQNLAQNEAKKSTTSRFFSEFGNRVAGAAPAIGSTVGAIGGGIAGGLVSSPSILGIPAGVYAGGVAGAAAGGAAGEAFKEKMQTGKVSGKQVAKTGAGFGALEAVAGPAFSLAGKGLEAGGEMLGKIFIPKSEAEAGALQAYKAGTSLLDRVKGILNLGGKKAPMTAGSAAFEKGLVGTESMIGVQAKRAQTTIWQKIIGPALTRSDVKITMPDFLNEAEALIKKETPELTRQGSLLNALESIKEDYAKTGEITLAKLQKLKEGWAEFVPEKAYKGQPIAGALNEVRNKLASLAREKIYNALGDNVKQAYLDYGNLNGITALGRKAMTGSIKGGTGTTLKNLLEQATIPVGTLAGQVIYKVGQGIELLGKPGARIVRNLLFSPLDSPSNQPDTTTSSPNQ